MIICVLHRFSQLAVGNGHTQTHTGTYIVCYFILPKPNKIVKKKQQPKVLSELVVFRVVYYSSSNLPRDSFPPEKKNPEKTQQVQEILTTYLNNYEERLPSNQISFLLCVCVCVGGFCLKFQRSVKWRSYVFKQLPSIRPVQNTLVSPFVQVIRRNRLYSTHTLVTLFSLVFPLLTLTITQNEG